MVNALRLRFKRVDKKVKITEIRDMQLLFDFYLPLVVVATRGCTYFRELRSIVCNLKWQLW